LKFLPNFTIIVIFLFSSHSLLVYGQENQVKGNLVNQLADAYNQFDYDKSAELLNIAFNSLDKIPLSDRIEIYKYAAFIAIHNGNNTLAVNHFWNLLTIDLNYSLDPVTTAPKLMTLFQKTKIEFLEDLNTRIKQIQVSDNDKEIPWRSFVFPGWEQWHRGYNSRGAILSSAGLISIGGFVYSAIMANQKRKDYLNANDANQIKSLYNEYNNYYQSQYYFGYAFAAVWVLSQIDLALWSHTDISFNVSPKFSSVNEFYPVVSLQFELFPQN
jgi:hypothetical protein